MSRGIPMNILKSTTSSASPLSKYSEEYELTNVMSNDSIKRLHNILNELKNNFGDGFELAEVIADLENAATAARQKNREIELLSFFAFNSNHESITDQRKQLFLTTKMIYDDKIKEIQDHLEEYGSDMDMDRESPSETVESKSKYDILDIFYTWHKKAKLIKKIVWSKNV